jgi:hypothetical protein
MAEDTGKSWQREIIVGVVVAVVSTAILTWLGLQKNDRGQSSPGGLFTPPVLPAVAPPSKVTSKVIDLTGTWMEPGGNIVSITQQGIRVTLRMPYLEAMGFHPALTTQSGTVEESPDQRYLAYISASNGTTTAQFYVTDGGNRLEGWVSNGFTKSPSVLIRSR